MKAIFSRRNHHNNHNSHAHGTRRYSEESRASSSSDVTPTPHLLAPAAASAAAALLPPLTSHSGQGRRHSLTKHHSHDFHHSTPPPHPPRPSPDSTISTRKSHASTHISASEQTRIQSNLQADALIRAREHDLRKRQQEWKDGPLSLPSYMMTGAGGGGSASGGSTESGSRRSSDNSDGSCYDSDTAVSELTTLSVQTNEDDVRASLVLPRDVKKKKQKKKQKQKRQGKKSKESKDDTKSDKPIKQKQKKMKPKSIFRSKLKYTKQVNDAITRRLSSRSNHSAQSDTSTMAAVIVSATSSKASSCSKDASSSYTGVAGTTNNNNNNNEWNGTATSAMAPYYPYQANPASPKTPMTVASLDYSSSDGDNTPKSNDGVVNDDDDDALSSPLFPTPTPADDDTNSSDANEVFQNLSTPTSPVLLPALQAHSQGKGNCFEPPSPPRRTASIISQDSSSKDTYSTLSTRSWTTNLSTQSAPEARMLETLTEAKRANQSSISRFKTNRRLRDGGSYGASTRGSHHRRAKSTGADMDELFAAVIKITDVPRYDIEDMLSIRHNPSMVSDTTSRAGRSVATSTKSLPANILRSTKGSGDDDGVDSQISRARQLLQKRRELTNSISGMRLVKQDEERKNAALTIPQTPNNKNKPLGPRFRTQSGNEIAPPSQSPPQPPRPSHRRKPSREEVILSAPHMPVLIRPPSSSPAQSRKNSLDSAQQQSQSSLDEIERELEIERERLSPHVMFRDERQGRLCSFCSHNNPRSGNVTPHSEMAVYHSESFDLEENEERLDSEIYQTFLEMAQFDVQVTELNDYDSFISSISSERSSQADG